MNVSLDERIRGSLRGDEHAMLYLAETGAADLMAAAEPLTLAGFGEIVTWSRKVFIPLTELCRDVCHYCTFAKVPRRLAQPYLSAEQVLAIACAGAKAGCKEALFTLGDKPELRYPAARAALDGLGVSSTVEYLERMARQVLDHTGLLPHLNPGVMTADDLARLRPVSASMGLMLEGTAPTLARRGGPHYGSPDKSPERRLETLAAAGALGIPVTTGLLIGIGENRVDRIRALLAILELHQRHGHVQEIILQNFRAKPGTRMANAPEPSEKEHLWTISVARLLFGPAMSLQAPPNLRPGSLGALIRAGINDWGGISPVTLDHVNPEAPWPALRELGQATALAGRDLVERLALVPAFAAVPERWCHPDILPALRRHSDARGYAREDGWFSGTSTRVPDLHEIRPRRAGCSRHVERLIAAASRGESLDESQVAALFSVSGRDFDAVVSAADALRADAVGETVTYVVNRNINYTNICAYHCGFCAFSKGRGHADLRGKPYVLDLEEIASRTREAAQWGATEVCLQGGIHPRYTGHTYLEIVRAVRAAVPRMHVHAFSPLEVSHGAATLGLGLHRYLAMLRDAGLSTLPGTAAEILDDEVREVLCPDKLRSNEWLAVLAAAHDVGLRTTATVMYGHVEGLRHWARHLIKLRDLQRTTRGITEFVPLGYVHQEAPLWRRGRTRSGPTFRESVLMHAVPRLVLHALIPNIQTSWVKMGSAGAAFCLGAGANDLGGTLFDESITRSAGGVHGQLLDARQLEGLAANVGRPARQRTTCYATAAAAAA